MPLATLEKSKKYAMTQTSCCEGVLFPLKISPRVPTSNSQLRFLRGAPSLYCFLSTSIIPSESFFVRLGWSLVVAGYSIILGFAWSWLAAVCQGLEPPSNTYHYPISEAHYFFMSPTPISSSGLRSTLPKLSEYSEKKTPRKVDIIASSKCVLPPQ